MHDAATTPTAASLGCCCCDCACCYVAARRCLRRLLLPLLLLRRGATHAAPPTADAGGPYFVTEGGTVVLSGADSSDPNQSTASLTFQWDLDGDGMFGESGAAALRGDETGETPTFSAAGLDGLLSHLM